MSEDMRWYQRTKRCKQCGNGNMILGTDAHHCSCTYGKECSYCSSMRYVCDSCRFERKVTDSDFNKQHKEDLKIDENFRRMYG